MTLVGLLCFGIGFGLLMPHVDHPYITGAVFCVVGALLVFGSWIWHLRADARRPSPPPPYVDKVPR